MNAILNAVEQLGSYVNRLLNRLKVLEEKQAFLEQQLKETQIQLNAKNQELLELKQQSQSLKVANALLGSEDNKRETKLKINALIREIDHCISRLSQ